jgi:hypothetical protein
VPLFMQTLMFLGLSVVTVTAGVGQVRLLADAPEVCEDANLQI